MLVSRGYLPYNRLMEHLKKTWADFGQGITASALTAVMLAPSHKLATGLIFGIAAWVAMYTVTEIVKNYK